MVDYQFILNPETDALEIEEPVNYRGIELSIIRDDKSHGIGFEASTSALQFFGEAAIFLEEQKTLFGLKADVIFQAKAKCEGEEEYTEVTRGKLNFGKWKKSCGNECIISLPMEEDSCIVTLHNRFDQKVDLDSNKGFDNFTTLPSYAQLGIEMELPTKELKVSTEGYVAEGGDEISLDIFVDPTLNFAVRPTYGREIYASINQSQLTPNVFAASDNGFNDSVISPVVLLDDDIKCFDGVFEYEVRFKGSYAIEYIAASGQIDTLRLVVAHGEYPGSLTILHTQNLPVDGGNNDEAHGTFDYTFSGTLTLPNGDGFYAYLESEHGPVVGFLNGSVTFDGETYIKIEGVKACPPTDSQVYLIHEALSRAVEAPTDFCVRVKSSFYGRTDSEPFSFDEDGCGALRFVTSGLKIRRAPTGDKFYASPKELMDGLQAIDNIGFGLEVDPDRSGKYLLVIEDLEHFYRDQELLVHDSIPDADITTEENKHYSKVNVGYKKWEVENINGLDEIHSNREYRTSLNSVSNTLDVTSNLVAGSYPIETTRQQSFADSGGADTKYDNEIFITTLKRNLYGFEVEQGNIVSPANIYSPDTIYNYRLSPLRNLMRWYRSIIPSYANYSDSDNKLFFSAGTGNLLAEGELDEPTYADDPCKLENGVIKENQNLFTTHFRDDRYKPIWRNELITYEYPLSVAEYKALKANPYGYISYQCGDSDFEKGFIKEIKFKPAEGKATFILKKKWQ